MQVIKKVQNGRNINEFAPENLDDCTILSEDRAENMSLRREVAYLRKENESLNLLLGYIKFCANAAPATAFTCDLLNMLEELKK